MLEVTLSVQLNYICSILYVNLLKAAVELYL